MPNELLDLTFEGDALLSSVADILVVPVVFVVVPLGVVYTQRVTPLKYPSLLRDHENVLL